MKRRVALVAVVLAVMLLGSAAAVFADTTSRNTDPQVGITKDQLVQELGQPLYTASDGNGGTILVYEADLVGMQTRPRATWLDQYYVDAGGNVYQHRHALL